MATKPDSPKVVIVTGDVAIDWNLARTRRGKGDSSSWNADDSTRAHWQRGGAALLADLIACVTEQLRQSEAMVWEVRQMAAPTEPVCPEDRRYHHSYALWSNQSPPSERPAWRVDEFLGLDPRSAHGATAPGDWEQVRDDTPEAELVVLDDAALGFRNQRELWPRAITDSRRPWVLLKMARPVAQGDLWEHLCAYHADRLVVVMTVDDLRRTEVQISRELSWERTAQDLAWELKYDPRVNALSRCAVVVISFGTAGAFLLSGFAPQSEPAAGDAFPHCRLFFDPMVVEGMWGREHPGQMIGYTTCLAAGLTRELMLSLAAPNLTRGIQLGLAAMRTLHVRGYGCGSTAPVAELAFPTKLIAGELARDVELFAAADVRDPVRSLDEKTPSGARQPRFWSILQDRYIGDLGPVAERIALNSAEAALDGVPIGQFGRLLTVDRQEIESFRSIRALVREYWCQGRQKPLSIAVFGAPGSGKSFGVVEVANTVLPNQIRVLQFNLSQSAGPDDLLDAFHQVRDVGLTGLVPLVFWDEFDTTLVGQQLGWLRYFLAPMQDGTFQQGQITHPIGRSIFVFAGGTSDTLDAFAQLLPENEFKAAKGPDFVSRLKGHINILGPNPRGGNTTADPYYIIRRALLLRSIFQRDVPHLFQQEGNRKLLNIDRGVLRAFLHARFYKHGVRSIESIVAMSLLTGKTSYERSSVPAESQLNLHVDPQDFLALVHQIELEREVLERLAEAAHEVFCEGLRAKGYLPGPQTDEREKTHSSLKPYAELPDHEKEQNRGTVRDIANKLAVAGYVMIPARSNEPPFSFPGEKLEELAEMEHERWLRAKLEAGWRYAPQTDKVKKLHQALLPWRRLSPEETARRYTPAEMQALRPGELPEEEKEKDRELVRGIPQILSKAGYTIIRTQQGVARS